MTSTFSLIVQSHRHTDTHADTNKNNSLPHCLGGTQGNNNNNNNNDYGRKALRADSTGDDAYFDITQQ